MEFMVLLLCSLVLTARAAERNPAVLDLDGDELQRGQLYHALSTLRPGGGLTLATGDSSSSCPVYVAQAPFPDWLGRPLTFSPEDPDDDTVRERHTLYVTFPPAAADDQCADSSGMWQVERSTGLVTTGGSPSDAIGPHLSRFAIVKYGSSDAVYQISACPCSIGANRPSCRMACLGSLGLSGANRLLRLGENFPHFIAFSKVRKEPQPQPSMKIRSVVVRPRPTCLEAKHARSC